MPLLVGGVQLVCGVQHRVLCYKRVVCSQQMRMRAYVFLFYLKYLPQKMSKSCRYSSAAHKVIFAYVFACGVMISLQFIHVFYETLFSTSFLRKHFLNHIRIITIKTISYTKKNFIQKTGYPQ